MIGKNWSMKHMSEHRLEELFFMTRALKQAMTDGIERWASDTDKRTNWLEADPLAWHVFSGTMLVGLFAFTEGRIGRFWWENLSSDSAKRDLPILWRARNAFVHADSKLVENQHNSADSIKEFEEYCTNLVNCELHDDKGNQYPVFMTLEDSVLRFNKEAVNQFRVLFECTFQAERLGVISE